MLELELGPERRWWERDGDRKDIPDRRQRAILYLANRRLQAVKEGDLLTAGRVEDCIAEGGFDELIERVGR